MNINSKPEIPLLKKCEKCNAGVFETIVDIDSWETKTRLCLKCYRKKYPKEETIDKQKKN